MNFKELISKIDIDKVIENDYDKRSGFDDLVMYFEYENDLDYKRVDSQGRLFGAYLVGWYCTDTWVGMRVFVFDREVVAFSMQTARKNDEEFEFVSKEAYDKVKDFIRSFTNEPEDEVPLIDPEEKVLDSEYYKIEYEGQLIRHTFHHTAILDGETVTVPPKKILIDFKKYHILNNKVNIIHNDGREEEVDVDRLKFPVMCLKKG
jgi:hypothetical protein